jgi:hypothetical protein
MPLYAQGAGRLPSSATPAEALYAGLVWYRVFPPASHE